MRGIFKLQQHRAEAARGKRCPAGNCSLLSDPMVCLLAPVLFHVQPFSPQPSPAFQEPSLPQTPGTPITHTQNFCSAFAEEESTEHLPWLCLEEESKTDQKKKKRDRNAAPCSNSCLVTWVLVIALICTWGFLAGGGFFSDCHFFVTGCFQTHYSWHLFTQAGSSLHQGHKIEMDSQPRCVI